MKCFLLFSARFSFSLQESLCAVYTGVFGAEQQEGPQQSEVLHRGIKGKHLPCIPGLGFNWFRACVSVQVTKRTKCP